MASGPVGSARLQPSLVFGQARVAAEEQTREAALAEPGGVR